MIQDFQHVCTPCSDPETSIRFCETLDLKVIELIREREEAVDWRA